MNAQHEEGDGDYDFDLFTIGGGTAGVRAARLAANLGRTLQWITQTLMTLLPVNNRA